MMSSRLRCGAREQGSVLLGIVAFVAVLSTILAVTISTTSHVRKMSETSGENLKMFYAAEAGLEKNYADLNGLIQNGSDFAQVTTIGNLTRSISPATAPEAFAKAGSPYVFTVNTVIPVDADGNPVDAAVDANPDANVEDYFFLNSSYVENRAHSRNLKVQLERPLKYSLRPVFLFGIFQHGNLEIHPTSAFAMNGRVHANGAVYFGSPEAGTLSFAEQVTAVDGIVNEYHPGHGFTQKPSTNGIHFAMGAQLTSAETPPFAKETNLSDANPNNDGPREMIEVPVVLSNGMHFTDALPEERLYHKAGLKVIYDLDKFALTFQTRDGTVIGPEAGQIYTALTNAVHIEREVMDYRRNATVDTVSLDVSKLVAQDGTAILPSIITSQNLATTGSGTSSAGNGKGSSKKTGETSTPTGSSALLDKNLWNGIVYVTVTGGGTEKKGVSVINGASLPSGGLTIASPHAVYIVGDYNTGGQGTAIPSNLGGVTAETATTVKNYTKRPAAVIADSVTILSGKWYPGNYNDVSNVSSRKASATTVNAAFIYGSNPLLVGTPDSFEKFVHVLENWSGVPLTMTGSFCSLYPALESGGIASPEVYREPIRSFYHEPLFRSGTLPPGTPKVKTLKKGEINQVF